MDHISQARLEVNIGKQSSRIPTVSKKIKDKSLKLNSFVKTSLPSADARLAHIGSNKYFTLHTFLNFKGKKFIVVSHIHREHTVSQQYLHC